MSVQRKRHGKTIRAYREVLTEDRRGNKVRRPDTEPQELKAVAIPQRSSRAEVPGQRGIEVYRLLVDPHMEGVTLWSYVEFDGRAWDIVTPPALRDGGVRRTRHWMMDVRARGGESP